MKYFRKKKGAAGRVRIHELSPQKERGECGGADQNTDAMEGET
jgi:hypothetical protein